MTATVYGMPACVDRAAAVGEVHARPHLLIQAPRALWQFAFMTDGDLAGDRLAMSEVSHRLGVEAPDQTTPAHGVTWDEGDLHCEKHTEFSTYLWCASMDPETGEPCGDNPFTHGFVPPGPVVSGVRLTLLPWTPETEKAAGRFDPASLCYSLVENGTAAILTDFRQDADGLTQILILARDVSPARAGALAQRLLEIETYRTLALLSLPLTRSMTSELYHLVPVQPRSRAAVQPRRPPPAAAPPAAGRRAARSPLAQRPHMPSFALYPSLKNTPVIVTGGASGIGAEIVRAFAGQHAKVGFVDFDIARGEALAAELTSGGAQVRFEPCDLRDVAALTRAFSALAAAHGAARVLVNNAARDDRHDWRDVTPEYYDERIATNLRHMFFAIQAVAPGMIAAGGGSIINLGSDSWWRAGGGFPVYTTSKAAVHGLTRGMARDLGPHRIRVNTLVPGWTMTERQKTLWVTPEGLARQLDAQCLPDPIEPVYVARMALFLASDDAAMCTANNYMVEAGSI